MWLSLFRAEWRKIVGHRWATGLLIGIFPGLAVLGTVIGLIAVALSASLRASLVEFPAQWTDTAIVAWVIPTNPLGQGLLLGFTAMLFAGENQWNTWKLIVPRSRRIPLILVKFFAVALFVVFAFALMSILLTLGMGLLSLAAGASYGPSIDGDVLAEFAGDYGLQLLFAFVSTIIAAGTVGLAAMITRTILGSVIVGFVVTVGQTLLALPLWLVASLLDKDSILHLFRFVPTWNLISLFSRVNGERPEGIEMPSGEFVVDTQLFNEVVLLGWIVGLVALTAYLFQRQDITN